MFKKLSLLTAGLLLSVSVFANDVQILIQKANSGNVQAQMELANYYRNIQDYRNQFYWEQKLANQGIAKAQYNLGLMYYNGQSVRQDHSQAFQWFLKSANQGNAKAQNNLGIIYANGYGVRQDYNIAKEWYGKACNQNVQVSCDNLKELNELGY